MTERFETEPGAPEGAMTLATFEALAETYGGALEAWPAETRAAAAALASASAEARAALAREAALDAALAREAAEEADAVAAAAPLDAAFAERLLADAERAAADRAARQNAARRDPAARGRTTLREAVREIWSALGGGVAAGGLGLAAAAGLAVGVLTAPPADLSDGGDVDLLAFAVSEEDPAFVSFFEDGEAL